MCTSFKNRCVAVILAAVLLFSTLPFGSFRVFAEGAGQLSTDIGTKTFRVGASEEFTFTTTAGDDAGTMVKGRFTFSDPDALETLEYLESKNGEWYEFSGDFGPETGFPLIDGTSRFRATFQKAGTYTVSAQMVRVDDDSVVCQTEAQVQVVYVNGTLTTDLSEKTFKLHEATEFTFTTTAGDDAGTMVKGRFTFNDQAALEKLEYLESKNGEWYEFSGDFGPETGFPLIDGTSRFRATFQKAGTYTVSAQMVRVDDDSVVCETTASINVAWNAAQLKTDIDKKNLVYGQKTEYTYTTVAGDDAGTMVKGRFTFSDPSALETLEYYEVMDGKWYPLNGEFGPSAGFPLSDATSRFRATFKKAGTFTCTVEIYSVEDQTVLCKDTTKITVQKAELTGISVVGTNNNYDGNEFELVKITGCEQGDKVSYWVNGEEETDTPPKRSAIGSYEVRVVVTRDENHASYEATVASMIWGTIDPGSGLIVQGTYCIYDGKPHDVVTVTRADGEGDYTLKYRMEGEGEDDWRTEIPQVTDAGSYTVYVKATKGNYNDLKVEVKPAEGAKYPFNVCIAKAEQNLVFADGETIEKTWSEDSESNKYTNAVSGGKTKEEVKYSAVADEMSNGLPCAEINEETGEVTFYGAGTVQVTAIKKGDNNYKDAEISYTLTIRRAAQAELRIESSIPSEFTYNENGNKIKLSTTGGSGDGAVTYGIQASPADCVELEGDTLTVRKSGVVQVTATKEKTDTYEAAQSEAKEITIQKATQSIAFEATPETVIYGTAYKNVAEPVEVSQAADRKGYAENTGITYKVIEGEEIASVEKDGSLSWKGGSVGKLTVQAIKAGDDCYKEASAEYTVTVAYAQLPETPYTIEGTRAEGSQGDWYIGDVTITPAEGYRISETNLTDESKWSTGLVITEEGTTEKTIYLRNNEDLGITDEITISNIRIDKTAPTDLQISYKTSLLDTILSVGSIGFYDAPVEVTVSASDDVAPVCEFVITYGDEQKIVKKGDAGFSEGKTANATITINPQFRGKVSFTAINEAGLRAASNQEKEPTIVVDNIAPNVTVKYDNYEVENGSYYKTDRTATIQIAEENFFPEAMTEKRSDDTTYLKIAVTRVDDNGKETTTNYTDETLTFTKKGNVWEAELSFTENGDYTLVVDYMDFSKNYDGKESHYETSFTIDKTDPVIVVTHENNDAVNDSYFKADRPVKVEITERNFDPAKVDLTVTASNANGVVADFAAYLKKADSWKKDGNRYTAEFTFETEASYTFDISVTDLAGRRNQDVSYGESVAPTAFTIDKTAPVIVVTHENNDAANGSYFKADRPVKVEITERNFDPAKVDLTVTASNANGVVADFAAYLKKADSWKKDGNRYTAEFTFETEADYTFDISVTDLAERRNQDVSYVESVAPKAFTIDKTDPVIVVTHENNDAANGSYFKADRPVKVEITEHNFDPAKVDLMVTARNATGAVTDFAAYLKNPNNWKTEGDKHTAEFPFETEASYTFDISVTDLAGRSNQDVSYGNAVAPTAFTIDKTDPVIKVTHSNNSAKNGSYFKADRPVKVEITERNFDPAKVDLTVTARNATGAVTDFAAYLKNPDSWRTEGDKHTAEFTFETEADYTFDISVTDLAGRSNQDVSYVESVAPTAFTIDKTAPTDGEITIDGQSVRAENSLAFEKFYREAQSIKFTAKFDISGKHSIEYQKVTSLSAAPEEGKWLPYTNSVAAQPNERFVIYFRAEDRAGNVRVFRSTGIVVDDQAPVGEKNAPEIDILPQAGNENGIHTADVAVSLRVVDPKYLGTTANEKNGYYSGLKEITYRIYAQDTGAEETGTLLRMGEKTVGDVTAENGLVSAWSGSINVSAGKFNSNYVFVEVTAVDNAGNKRITTVDSPIRIDTTAPRISVSYDNNNGDATFANGSTDAFFKEGRTATIVVTERNFDPALVALTLTNRTGATPVLSGWRTEQGSGNGDDTRHIATLYYGTDGEYTFGISCKDLAGLSSTAVSYQGLAPQRFTIDRTAPVISVVYDNMDAKNENHYKASRTATITITERNFEQSRLTIRLTATDHGEAIKAPEISAWSSSGDTHTATIRYDADALYSFDISYRDKAGNAADRYRGDTFYVDQTLPKVTLSGIADESANSEKGDIGFVLTATDTNLDEFTPVITAVLMEDGQIVKRELAVGESKPIEDGMEFVVKNLPDDGIYRITCTVTDKAGNAFEEITLYRKDGTAYTAKRTGADDLLTFSVNRSGSVYEMTSYTAALTEKYYVQRVTEEVAIVEINADPLISYVVTLGGKELQEGTDYTVSIEGGSGDWRKYTYHVQSTLFDAEGEYNLVISSVDGAENDAFSDVKGASIHFVVDRTAPVVAVSGLAAGGRYQTTKQQVTLIPTDDGGALKSLRVLLVDDDGETLEELVNLQGEALEKALEENDGKITFEMSEGLYQNVRIICDDCADYGDEENIIYDKVFRNVSVSSSAFMIFWANKPLRWGVIGGVSAVVLAALLVLLLKKRKKKD